MAAVVDRPPLAERASKRAALADRRTQRLQADIKPDNLHTSNTFTHNLQRGPAMAKITVSKTNLPEPKRGRESTPNQFLDVIASFNDGKTRTVKCDANEKPATLLGQLRAAAKDNLTPPRGVRAVIDETANSFDFKLIDFVARPRKAKEDGETPAS